MIARAHIVKWIHQSKTLHVIPSVHFCSDPKSQMKNTDNFLKYDADPSHQFMEKQNRELMHSLTSMQIDRVFRVRPTPVTRPTSQLLSAAEVKAKFEGALRTAC